MNRQQSEERVDYPDMAKPEMKVKKGDGAMSRVPNGVIDLTQDDLSEILPERVKLIPLQPTEIGSSTEKGFSKLQEDLNLIKEFLQLQSTKFHGELDDDAFATRMARIDRLAKQRVAFMPDLEADSEDEENRIVRGEAYREKVDMIVCQDLCRDISSFAKASNRNLDKSIAWLKKCNRKRRKQGLTGLVGVRGSVTHSNNASGESDNNQDDASQLRRERRLTRGMARHSRVRKREERMSAKGNYGLQSLLAAAKDFKFDDEPRLYADDPLLETREEVCDSVMSISRIVDARIKKLMNKPKVQPNFGYAKNNTYQALARNPNLDLSAFVRISEWLSSSGRAKSESDLRIQVKVTSIIVDRNNVEPIFRFVFKDGVKGHHLESLTISKKTRPRAYGQGSSGGKLSVAKKTAKVSSFREPSSSISFSSKIKNSPSQGWRRGRKAATSGSSETVFPIFVMMRDPPGIGACAASFINGKYQCWSSELMKYLSSGSRSFSRYESFYSDIDRPWFNYDWYRADKAREGISRDARSSTGERSIVRRKVFACPQRFSPRFIKKELRKLEDYRTQVRCLQHTGLPRPEGFPFEVARPFEIGATAITFNRDTGLLDRCVVLHFDFGRCLYDVRFISSEGEGSVSCLDTEIASEGFPESLYDLDPTIIDGPDYEESISDDEQLESFDQYVDYNHKMHVMAVPEWNGAGLDGNNGHNGYH